MLSGAQYIVFLDDSHYFGNDHTSPALELNATSQIFRTLGIIKVIVLSVSKSVQVLFNELKRTFYARKKILSINWAESSISQIS